MGDSSFRGDRLDDDLLGPLRCRGRYSGTDLDRIATRTLVVSTAETAGSPQGQRRPLGPQSDRRLHPQRYRRLRDQTGRRSRSPRADSPRDLRPHRPAADRSRKFEAFVQDQRPDAYERVVDRLLASPHYGERSSGFGSISPASPKATASKAINPAPTLGAIAIGLSTPSTPTCPTTASSAFNSPATKSRPKAPPRLSPRASIAPGRSKIII